jgi:hypothetical protein
MTSLLASAPSRTADVAAQAHGAVALGDGRVRLGWGGPQTAVTDGRPDGRPGSADVHLARLVRLLLAEAVSEAAVVQRHASGQSAAISDVAEREAAEISRQASAQIAAIREAAEREAAELRAAVMEMTAGAAGMASVAEGLIGPAWPDTKPLVRPATGAQGRQVRAMRKVVIALAALCLVGVGSGAAEMALHGFGFFLFRNAGAGAGNSRDLNENQGPGQPDAPRAHRAHQTVHPR